MQRAGFEWDDEKNRRNVEKHGVSFYDAQGAFFDPTPTGLSSRTWGTAWGKGGSTVWVVSTRAYSP